MRISPALAALRADPAPLVAAQTRAAAMWRGQPDGAGLAGEVERYGAGAALGECELLAGLLEPDADLIEVRALLSTSVAAMREAPLAPVPWRHFTNGVLHSIALAASGRASLSLALIDGPAWTRARDPQAAELVAFQPGELRARVLAGQGRAWIIRNRSDDPARAVLDETPLRLEPGAAYQIDGAHEALAFDAVSGALVTLRLHRRPETAQTARQYDAASGALVHQAAGDQRDSRAEMIMALLRAMDRADAAPTLAELAREGQPAARWQALRECLALDSGVGLGALLEVAGTPGDPVAAPARALLDTLAARHPEIAAMREDLLCPA